MPLRRAMDVGAAAIAAVDTALEAFWSLHVHIPSRIRLQVGIAAAEIAADIVEHSGARRMSLTIEVAPAQVQVIFTDDGHPLEMDLAAVAMPDPLSEGGRGLPLHAATLSRLSYDRDHDGNRWTLVSREFDGATEPGAGSPPSLESAPAVRESP